MIKKYIKKPVEVEAIQLTEDNIEKVLDFICDGRDFDVCFYESREEIIALMKANKFHLRVKENNIKVNFGDYIVKGYNNLFYKMSAKEFEATYQSVDNFIDLNKLKNYEFFIEGADLMAQYGKVKEEINEFYLEFIYRPNGERIISEGLDVITAMYNYLTMIGLSKKDFEKHITKLNKYKETKYKK